MLEMSIPLRSSDRLRLLGIALSRHYRDQINHSNRCLSAECRLPENGGSFVLELICKVKGRCSVFARNLIFTTS